LLHVIPPFLANVGERQRLTSGRCKHGYRKRHASSGAGVIYPEFVPEGGTRGTDYSAPEKITVCLTATCCCGAAGTHHVFIQKTFLFKKNAKAKRFGKHSPAPTGKQYRDCRIDLCA
jgi:hypothetical protein